MNYFITERQPTDANMKNAANKARADVETILSRLDWKEIPIVLPYKEKNSLISSVTQNIDYYNAWKSKLSDLKAGDSVLIQFPPKSHSLLYPHLMNSLRRRGVESIFLIHDLERLRYINDTTIGLKKKLRMNIEDTTLLKSADKVIAHNPDMIKYLIGEGIPKSKLVSLGIFDYVMDNFSISEKSLSNQVIIAGNLSAEKVGYISYLSKISDVSFQLYGVGFDEDSAGDNITYHGSFMPDELPEHLQGSFGLVWDGDSADTCSGMYGDYLRYNDPHKTSLYLSCGFPVIVWKESAISKYVLKHNAGIAVSSLYEIGSEIAKLTPQDYAAMCENARKIAANAQKGNYLKTALSGKV